MEIREARDGEAVAVEELAVRVCKEDWPEYPVEYARKKTHTSDITLVAVDNGIKGIMGLNKCEPYKVLEVEYINIRKDARRKGIGKAMLKAAEDLAKSMGKEVVRTYTSPEETDAHEFYKACGYEESGRVRNYEDKGDEAVFFTKVIA